MKIAILGAGAWGTALGIALAPRHEIALWCRDPHQGDQLATARVNARYLPGVVIPAPVRITNEAGDALRSCELAIIAVPTAALRETARHIAQQKRPRDVVWLCKGFESGTAKFPHQMVAEELGEGFRFGALSGPSFAEEVARGLPAAVTLASHDAEFAAAAAREIHGGRLRVYSSDDLAGVETGGAIKNVIAIAVGVCDGLSLGSSARAALITRGVAEMTRLGMRLGGRLETFMGLAGVGDLVLTATSDLSRNRRVGLGLAKGQSLSDILADLGHVAEGVSSAREVQRLALQLKVEMPITRSVCSVLDGYTSARAAVEELLQREPKPESGR
ncbi:MAG TPA: NAD(P)H-dependent glycerol-3-phosphate dehydrogenase [Burkholderiales bacterium]|jgi:glycerol-3-phosphate dehydrogenase (NAD(P)+)|nr:NAD(P)H-dependent glycerol-3-phosphate dehydrogenase [Burkholderiales bacterium]